MSDKSRADPDSVAGDRDYDELASQLAHELRNIVAPIRNALHVIRLRAASDPTIQSMTDLIDRQMTAMVELLDTERGVSSTGSDVTTGAEAKCRDATGSAAAAGPTALPSASRRRILVADDSVAVRDSITALLRDLGHDVRTAGDAAEALDIAQEWKPEFVLLDIHMPGPSGLVVARRLRSRFAASEMTLVMMSGIALDDVTRSAAQDAGFDHCLDKAFTLTNLQQLLEGARLPESSSAQAHEP
jgi:CheY-like chemotaxis protein